MDDLIERLQAGCVYRPKRWSGDTHDDLGGPIDEAATESLLAEAAEALEAAREDAERYRWLRDCDDGNIAAFYIDAAGAPDPTSMLAGSQLDDDIDAAREARNG